MLKDLKLKCGVETRNSLYFKHWESSLNNKSVSEFNIISKRNKNLKNRKTGIDGNMIPNLYPIVCLRCIVVNFYLDFMGCGYGFPFDNSFMSHPCYIPKIPVSIFAIKRLHTTGCEII